MAGLNFAYFFVEFSVALAIGSVSLFADSVDFLEDTSINLLIFLALGLSLRWQALAGKVMALILLMPAAAAAWEAFSKIGHPTPPDPFLLTAGGAAVVKPRVRAHPGPVPPSLELDGEGCLPVCAQRRAGQSRNHRCRSADVVDLIGIPDLVLGTFIIVIMLGAAKEVWEACEEERLAAKALAGEEID